MRIALKRRDAREAEGARLLSEYPPLKGIEGSNPSLSAMHHVGCMAALNLTWFRAPGIMHHALNHVRFRVSPELHVVQDKVHDWQARNFAKQNLAPIAQMDRASDYESAGRVFESPWARHAPRRVHGSRAPYMVHGAI